MNRIWNDGAFRRLPLWLAITMMSTNVLLGLVFWRQATVASHPQPLTGQLLTMLWLAVTIYLLGADVRTRCHHLELALPIPARTLWWRHLLAVVLGGAVILAGSLIVLAGNSQMLVRLRSQHGLEVSYLELVAPLVGGLLLAASLIGSLEPGLWKIRGQIRYWVFLLTSLLGILLILLLLQERPWIAMTMCVGMAGLIAAPTLKNLPPAFRVVPFQPSPASRGVDVAASGSSSASPWQVLEIVFAVLHTTPPWKQFTPWMLYFFVALMGFITAGGFERVIEAPEFRFLYLPMGSYMLLAGFGLLTYHLYRLDPLPVSRRLLFALIILPGIALFVVGYLTGRLTLATAPDPAPPVSYRVLQRPVGIDLPAGSGNAPRGSGPMVWVEVPQSYMKVSPTGEVPTLTSPWGESHPAWSQKMFQGFPLALYSPYNTAEETTAEFEALMTSRAIEDIYGVMIPAGEIRDRYFIVEDNRVTGLVEDRLALVEDYALPRAAPTGPELPVYMTLVLVPALLLAAVFVHSFRAEHSNGYIRAIYWISLGLLLGILIAQAVLAFLGLFDAEAGRGLLAVLIFRLGSSPLSWTVTWLVALGAIYGSYRLALQQFERAEIPASPINCSMIDFSRSE